MRAHLLAGGAVNASVGHGFLPMSEMHILGAQPIELLAGQAVVLNIFDPSLDLSLVAGHGGLGRQDHRAIVFAEGNHLGIEFGLEPIDLLDGGPQVIDDQRAGDSAKMPERALNAPNEVLGSLAPEDLGVALARAAQDHAQNMRTAPAPVLHHPSPLAKIDLRLLSRLTLHPPERQGMSLSQLPHKALHRIVAAGELLLAHQVLINPLSGQAGVQTGLDDALKRLAVTHSARLGPGGRNGWVWRLGWQVARRRRNLRAGGHNGWV